MGGVNYVFMSNSTENISFSRIIFHVFFCLIYLHKSSKFIAIDLIIFFYFMLDKSLNCYQRQTKEGKKRFHGSSKLKLMRSRRRRRSSKLSLQIF
jgi:hypothetical protein